MSDVKELVPEFFYLPEMFKNVNNIDFGSTQSGEKVVYRPYFRFRGQSPQKISS